MLGKVIMGQYSYKMLFPTLMMIPACLVMLVAAEKQQEVTAEKEELLQRKGFGISVSVDKSMYTSGEQISMTLRVFNTSDQEVILSFKNTQRYEFIIHNEEGKKLWQWSEGRMFAQILGEEKVGPGREEIIYNVQYQDSLDPGTYKISGIVTARDWLMSASITVEVK